MSSAALSMRRHLWFGLTAILAMAGTGGAWAIYSSLDSAVVTQGVVVVETNVKKVQHPTGGVVGRINVREGQKVVEGDIIVRLDDTATRANLAIVINELTAIRARAARLMAERDNLQDISFPEDIATRSTTEADAAQMLRGERQLFMNRATTRQGQSSQLSERVGQLKEEIKGLREQKRAADMQLSVARDELKGLQGLRALGLVQKTRITALEREIARYEGLIGELISKASQSQGKIAETELQILQLGKDAQTEVAKDLRDAETKINELQERRIGAEDQLRRVDIRAPISGTVHQLNVHTVGGVISQTEPLMHIVPGAEKLIVEVKINPQDIDQVRAGQLVRVRFSAFNQSTTPELQGSVVRIAADLTREQQTGLAYYVAGVAISDSEIKKLEDQRLIPGMPAEAYITTGARSPMSFLVKPITDQMQRAMRER